MSGSSSSSLEGDAVVVSSSSSEWAVDLIAGWASGAAAVMACQPVDTVLTRWQAATPTAQLVATAAGSSSNNISNWRGLTMDLYQTSGFTALWRGASPMITAVPFQNALLMSGYGLGARFYSGQEDTAGLSRSKQLGAIFVGGCTGGVLQSFLMSPVELIKVAQQCGGAAAAVSSTAPSSSPLTAQHVVRKIAATSTATRGLGATLLRDGIPHGVWFVAYDVCKATCLQQLSSRNNGTLTTTAAALSSAADEDDDESCCSVPVSVSLVSGAAAAAVAWAVGYPADLIKTRIQASAASPSGILETARLLVREADGRIVAGLYRGFGMKLVRSVPASMIGFTVYEGVKEQIHRIERHL